MNYFEQIFKQKLNEFTKDKRLYETPIVRFIDKLRKDKVFNKPIKIPVINTEFDNDELVIEYDGNLYTWHIEDRFSNEKEHSRDQFSTLEQCLKDLIKVLKDQVIESVLNDDRYALNQFMDKLALTSNHNKYIKISNLDTNFDGKYVFIDTNKGYSWYISEKESDDEIIDQSEDVYKTLKQCLASLDEVLR